MREEDSVKLLSSLQELNALSPIEVNVSGILTAVRLLLKNAPVPMAVTFAGIEKVVSVLPEGYLTIVFLSFV